MEEDTKTICLNFKRNLEEFTETVQSLVQDGALPYQEKFLCHFAENINKLYDSSVRVLQCQDEEVKEIGELVHNIFIQPLSTKEKKAFTILNAMHTFSAEKAQNSELSSVLKEYITHPETTKSFLRELELLSEDLDSAISA